MLGNGSAHAACPTRRWGDLCILVALLLAAVFCRLPALLNAGGVHSDAAIVGLQARHILRGEWAWFIWGTDYQGIVDPLLVAAGFALGGATPLALMLVPLLGHLLLVGLTFVTLRRHLDLVAASVATLVVVCTPQAINGVALYAPRQWGITAVVAAVWLLDGAARSRRPLPRYAGGVALGALALYLDLFTVQFLPGLALFALACARDGAATCALVARRAGACVLGLAGGLALLALSRLAVTAGPNQLAVTAPAPTLVRRNAALLWDQCLPWLLGYKVYIPGTDLYPALWQPPRAFQVVQLGGATLLLLGLAGGGVALLTRRLPWPVRRLGGLGCLVGLTSLVGFLVSSSPTDMWGARYLAPILWLAPCALVPAAYLLAGWRFPAALAPYLLAALVGGWLGFGTYVRAGVPIREPRGLAAEEAQLGAALRARGVRYGAADYWLAYRLTFLWGESPVMVPLDPSADRYAPFRRGYEAAPIVAYIYHPSEPRATPEPCEAWLRGMGARYERVTVAEFTAFVWERGPRDGEATGCVAAMAAQRAPSAKK